MQRCYFFGGMNDSTPNPKKMTPWLREKKLHRRFQGETSDLVYGERFENKRIQFCISCVKAGTNMMKHHFGSSNSGVSTFLVHFSTLQDTSLVATFVFLRLKSSISLHQNHEKHPVVFRVGISGLWGWIPFRWTLRFYINRPWKVGMFG